MIRAKYSQREYEDRLREANPEMDEFAVMTASSKYEFLTRFPLLEMFDEFEPTLKMLEGMVDGEEEETEEEGS